MKIPLLTLRAASGRVGNENGSVPGGDRPGVARRGHGSYTTGTSSRV